MRAKDITSLGFLFASAYLFSYLIIDLIYNPLWSYIKDSIMLLIIIVLFTVSISSSKKEKKEE